MKSKTIFYILGILIFLLAASIIYKYLYLSRGVIEMENSNVITLKHSCFVYYQGDEIEPSWAEKAFDKDDSVKQIRLYAPGEEQVTEDILDISASIQLGEYDAISLFSSEFAGKEIDESAYTIEATNIKVSEVSDYKTKVGTGFLEEMTIGKGYKVDFDIILTFKNQATPSENFLKIAINYPKAQVQGMYYDRNEMDSMNMGLSDNPFQKLISKFQSIKTGEFEAVFLPLDNSQHPYTHKYFLSKEYYYKVRLN